jgi:hypothetical protein
MTEAPEAALPTAVVTDGTRLELEAACLLAEARSMVSSLHAPGQRERYRRALGAAIYRAERAVAAGATTGARSTLASAHAERAEDALHGAGQLSLSAQRAPTLAACNDGWERVEAIVTGAEGSAGVAAAAAAELDALAPGSAVTRQAREAARRAGAAARSARKVVQDRNHAYTFHADGGFSFGEGWYLAAAAVLAGVAVQIEPGKDQTSQAERFLRDAGLGDQLRQYRSRPRAMKHVTELVAAAFRAAPEAAQRKLRAAFLGDAPTAKAIADWVDVRLSGAGVETARRKKVLLWIREGVHHPRRNTKLEELLELTASVERAGLVPVWTGDAVAQGAPAGVIDLILFWKEPLFRGPDLRRAQLQFFEHLREQHGVIGQLGVTTAGMDGPALLGLPTMYLTDAPNVRMREWVGAVPEYREIVRGEDHLERIGAVLSEWAGSGATLGLVP